MPMTDAQWNAYVKAYNSGNLQQGQAGYATVMTGGVNYPEYGLPDLPQLPAPSAQPTISTLVNEGKSLNQESDWKWTDWLKNLITPGTPFPNSTLSESPTFQNASTTLQDFGSSALIWIFVLSLLVNEMKGRKR